MFPSRNLIFCQPIAFGQNDIFALLPFVVEPWCSLVETIIAAWAEKLMQFDNDSINLINPGGRRTKDLFFSAFNVDFQNIDAPQGIVSHQLIDGYGSHCVTGFCLVVCTDMRRFGGMPSCEAPFTATGIEQG
jgi:hypothetical protein